MLWYFLFNPLKNLIGPKGNIIINIRGHKAHKLFGSFLLLIDHLIPTNALECYCLYFGYLINVFLGLIEKPQYSSIFGKWRRYCRRSLTACMLSSSCFYYHGLENIFGA